MATDYDTVVDIEDERDDDDDMTALTAITGVVLRAPQHTREELEALKDTIKAANRSMTDAQFTVFMAAARHLGLDPLARQIVPVFQGDRMTVQTTIDGFRLIAERTHKYRGQLGPFWCGPDGEWKDVWLADGAPTAAKVGVRRSDFDEIMWGVARTKSYTKGGNWVGMPDVMIAKVAESLALRKAFPAELSGAYTAEEMAVVDADPAPPRAIPAPARPAPATTQAAPVDERVAPALRNRDVLGLLSDLGITDQAKRRAKVTAAFTYLDTSLARTATERDLMDALEAQIASKRTTSKTAAQASQTGSVNGHDLREAFTGPMPN